MADNILDISILCPLKFRKQGFTNEAPYNTKFFDDWNFSDTIRPEEEVVDFKQHWQKNDIIYVQILSNYAPHQLEMYDCNGDLVAGAVFVLDYIPTSIEGSGVKVYEASVALDTYDEGFYKFLLKSGSPVLETYESEWIDLKALHGTSVQLKYKHDENDYETVFETGIEFQFRIPGGLIYDQPGADRTVFIDQPRNMTLLSSKSFSIWKLFIGEAGGVPPWLIERVNDIFNCSTVLIDGRQYIANGDAKFEANREKEYPMAGWVLEVRPSKSQNKKRFVAEGNQGSPSSVVYQIDSRGFGTITGPASSNVIKIENLD